MKFFITASGFGHICSFHLPYIKGLRQLGHSVDVACGGELRDIPFADRLIPLPMQKRMFSAGNFKAALILRREIKNCRYDRVITHTSLAAFFTRLALLGLKERPMCIDVMHGYLFDDSTPALKAAVLKCAEYICAPVTDLLLTMNVWDRDWASKRPLAKRKAFIPGMGADSSRLEERVPHDYGFGPGAFILIYPAEFSKRKNQSFLIEAMAQLPDRVKLVLPGRGELLAQCRELAEQLNVSARVLFPGFVDDVIPWLMGADAAVTSSRSEGLPFNVIEAMQCGLPVLASKAKGNVDLVKDGVNGYVFDDKAGLVSAVNKLLSDMALKNTMGEQGRKMAESYSLESAYPHVMEEYLS